MFRVLSRAARCVANSLKAGSPAVVQSATRAFSVLAEGANSQGFRSFPYALGLTTATAILVVPAVAAAPQERSFIMIKPDGVHRGLIADIIKRFEAKGYKLVGIKVLVPTSEIAGQHYAEHEARPFFPKLVNFLSSGPVIAMVWEGKEVIKYGRTMIGATNPIASAPGTIRGDYGIDVGRNIIHGSDSTESAQREIALWFRPEELASYEPVANPWIYE